MNRTPRCDARPRSGIALLAVALLSACAQLPRAEPDASIRLRLIGERVIEHRLVFGGTTVGGLSGIDYDPSSDRYVLISDDRSRLSPARFYVARLSFDATRFDDATLLSVVTLRRRDGEPFSPTSADEVADGEAIRFDARTGRLWWTSEGERTFGRKADPFVRATSLDGRYVDAVPLDPMFGVHEPGRGPRDNLVFEGLSLTPDGDALWVAMEAPLMQDGPLPTTTHGAWSRFSRHPRRPDGSFGALTRQIAYPVDPLPASPLLGSFALNSVSEILAVADDRVLVLERAYVLGHGWSAKLFEVDLRDATDVRLFDSLDEGRSFTPATKRLVLDFAALGILVDNLEGMCFGPVLPNGHRTLVFVSDDNFNPGQKTQLLAFEILPS